MSKGELVPPDWYISRASEPTAFSAASCCLRAQAVRFRLSGIQLRLGDIMLPFCPLISLIRRIKFGLSDGDLRVRGFKIHIDLSKRRIQALKVVAKLLHVLRGLTLSLSNAITVFIRKSGWYQSQGRCNNKQRHRTGKSR